MSDYQILMVAGSAALSATSAYLVLGEPTRSSPSWQMRSRPHVRAEPQVLQRYKRYRQHGLESKEALSSMPVLLDLLHLGLLAGLSFDAALQLYCERSDTHLAKRLSGTLMSWQLGLTTRQRALSDLANELDVDALDRFSSAVAEALAFGSPLAQVLSQQAHTIRDQQRAQIEEQIEKAPVKMLIPLGTLIVPAMLLAILGPFISSALVTIG